MFVEFALEYPEFLSSMRLLEQFGIESHNDDLDDISPAQTLRYNAVVAEALETLREYDRTDLNGQVALSYDILEWYLQTEVDGAEFAFHGYPVNQQFGEQNGFPLFMTSTHYLGDRGDAQDYVARLGKLDGKFAGLLEDLGLRESRGIVPPLFVIDRVLEEMRTFVSTPVRDNILYQSFERRISDIVGLSNESRTALLDDAAHQVEHTVYPAYNDLIDYFVALRPKVTTNHGALALPDGRDWYAWLLRRATTTDMTPEAVHAMGLTEVARIEAEMDAILGAEGYTDGSVGERMQQLADEPRAERDVISEIERYFVNPGQATAYKVGMHKLLELRKHAQSVLGDEFDLRQFHDLVLDNGSMPLIVLERQVEDFIVRQSNGTRDVP